MDIATTSWPFSAHQNKNKNKNKKTGSVEDLVMKISENEKDELTVLMINAQPTQPSPSAAPAS